MQMEALEACAADRVACSIKSAAHNSDECEVDTLMNLQFDKGNGGSAMPFVLLRCGTRCPTGAPINSIFMGPDKRLLQS